MQHMCLAARLAIFALLVTAVPASAQFIDPDPCFDISMSKSQYDACALDTGGYVGGGGMAIGCSSCVTGDWDANGSQYAQCKDSNVYASSWPQYSNCDAYISCWPGPYGFPICESGCRGYACLRI